MSANYEGTPEMDLYVHQFLVGIFHINLAEPMNSNQVAHKTIVPCFLVKDPSDTRLNFDNFHNYFFEVLVEEQANRVPSVEFIDPNYFPRVANTFSDNSHCAFDAQWNPFGYLFNCFYRCGAIKDFRRLLPEDKIDSLKKYIASQACLTLLCSGVHARYQADETLALQDLLAVLTLPPASAPIDYLDVVKEFFLAIVDEMIKGAQEDPDSPLAGLSKEEISVENLVKQVYLQFTTLFKEIHDFSPIYTRKIKLLDILLASPDLINMFMSLNSPAEIKEKGEPNIDNSQSSGTRNIFQFAFSFIPDLQDMAGGSANGENSRKLENHFYHSMLGILLSSSPLKSPFPKRTQQPFNLMTASPNSIELPRFRDVVFKSSSQIENEELAVDQELGQLRTISCDLIFKVLKTSPAVRFKMMKWIECCLATFNLRSTVWANELMSLVGSSSINDSDGMMTNLAAVMLVISKPFFQAVHFDGSLQTSINPKMLKVDLAYMRFAKAFAEKGSPHGYSKYLNILCNEATLVGIRSKRRNRGGGTRGGGRGASTSNAAAAATAAAPAATAAAPAATAAAPAATDAASSSNSSGGGTKSQAEPASDMENYEPGFVTRCFYATHKALHLGFRVLNDRYTNITQENSQLQRRFQELGIASSDTSMLSNAQRDVYNRYSQNLTITLSIKAALTENNFLNNVADFYIATAAWINNMVVCESEEVALSGFRPVVVDENDNGHDYFHSPPSTNLHYIPEFIIENIIDFMSFLRYYDMKPKWFDFHYDPEPLLTMVVLFMGTPVRMRNPHLRAKMADLLEGLLPDIQLNFPKVPLGDIFCKPYFVEELFPALLNVFVSIEISDEVNNGDVVAFEQKFNYRRPMYVAFKYLCTVPEHQKKLLDLADYAENNIDSVETPIFLRFINLLINDAIFLLDEGLSLMAKLKEKEQERDSGAWQNQNPSQRHHNEANFAYLGRLAKFHNYIGRDTITALCLVTDHVKSIFSHSILADRTAAMLNYFLRNLVGPNKMNFKVKQMNDYEFQPGDLVRNICRIYVNLGCRNPIAIQSVTSSLQSNPKYEEFCLAISGDDRSYTPDLLNDAHSVLIRLNVPMLGEDLRTVDRTIKDVARRHRQREIPLEDIPEDFLDPLMSTLMSDPVILPGSRKVLDRATITRHLLSDNTDPYTRTPLTMNMLIPDVELKAKIEEFISQKLKELDLNQQRQQNQSQSQDSSSSSESIPSGSGDASSSGTQPPQQ